jgi:hypothetical protein
MIPLAYKAKEGRVNPKGISCLYVAESDRVALSEVRPWVGSVVSIAEITILKDLYLIDCTKGEPTFAVFRETLSANDRLKAVWGDINQAFSVPIEPSDDSADYVPTQIIAEIFRSEGYDGVMYKSAFSKQANNISLFDVNLVHIESVSIKTVSEIRYVPLGENDITFSSMTGALSVLKG